MASFSLGFRQDYRIIRINRILEVTILSFELKALRSEIDQQSNVDAGGLEITYQLGFMHGKKPGHRLQFNDETFINYQVRNKISYHGASESSWNRNLLIHRHATRPKRNQQCVFINLLKISWPQFAVAFHRAPNHLSCQFFVNHKTTCQQ